MNNRITALACAVLLAAPLSALAADESPYSWEVTAVSDYVFRGASQTDEKPTLQAGFTYTTTPGIYASVWASGVDFGTSKPDAEVDVSIGWNTDFSDEVNFDIALNRYMYPGAGSSNYNELITTTTFAETYTATVTYSNDVWNTDTDGWYFGVGGEWALPQEFSLNAGVGYSTFDKDVAENYLDWTVGVSRSFGPATVGLAYVGTNSRGEYNFGEAADDRVVLSVSFGN
jgi:uncharacterized protein (TIGR02001 family)